MPHVDASFRAIKHQFTPNKWLWLLCYCSIIIKIIQPGPQLKCGCEELHPIGPYLSAIWFLLTWLETWRPQIPLSCEWPCTTAIHDCIIQMRGRKRFIVKNNWVQSNSVMYRWWGNFSLRCGEVLRGSPTLCSGLLWWRESSNRLKEKESEHPLATKVL